MGLKEKIIIPFLLDTTPLLQYSLAQTRLPDGGQAWLTKPDFYILRLQDIAEIMAFSSQVAPPDPVPVSGRGGRAIIPFEYH